MTEVVKDVPVENTALLDILNKYVDIFQNEDFEKKLVLTCEEQNDPENREKWVGEEYMREIVNSGTGHEGFPDHVVSYLFKPDNMESFRFKEEVHKNDPDFKLDFRSRICDLNTELMHFFGARNNALTAFYPPGGYISWHNNANAHAYNIIFSWSETGDGWFKYLDPHTDKVVTMHDKKGWQCKASYFGHYGERDRIVYHAASTDCKRITVSFIWNIEDASKDVQDDLIYDISHD